MKKKFCVLSLMVICILFVTGCGRKNNATEYVWQVSTGDNVSVKLDTTTGYSMTSELPFLITKDDVTYLKCQFLTSNGYDDYIDSLTNAEKIESDTKDGIDYTIYSTGTDDDPEYKIVLFINNSETGMLLTNNVSLTSTKDAFNLLTIKLD